MARKLFAFLLTVLLVVSVIGCAPAAPAAEQPADQPAEESGSDQEKQPEVADDVPAELVTLDYYWIGNGDTDQRELVEAAINEYIAPMNIAVKFHIIGWGDWDSKAITALQAGENIDVFFTADWRNYMQLASEGLFTPLNDDNGPDGNLLENYGQGILSTLNPAFIVGTQIDGVNYAVPTNKELTVPMGLIYNEDGAAEVGLTEADVANIKTMADIEPWLAKWKELHPDEYPYLADGWWGFEPWVPNFAVGVPANIIAQKFAPDANGVFDETIYFVWDTPEQQDFAKMQYDWMQKGYIHPDSPLSTWDNAPIRNSGKFLFETQPLKGSNIKAQELVNASGNSELKLKEIYGQPKVNVTTHAGGSMLAIPALSDHPVEAMKFINLMHSDPKLVNMMLFGVEGTHWEVEADGRVNIINSAWYGAHAGAWTVGNTQIQLVSNKEDPEKNRMLIEYSNDAVAHPSLGFRFRSEPVAAELTALQAVADGMNEALMTGGVDPEVELPNYIQALKDAGLDKVMAEVQSQYDEWKKTQD